MKQAGPSASAPSSSESGDSDDSSSDDTTSDEGDAVMADDGGSGMEEEDEGPMTAAEAALFQRWDAATEAACGASQSLTS